MVRVNIGKTSPLSFVKEYSSQPCDYVSVWT